MRNYDAARAPRGLGLRGLLRLVDGHTGRHMGLTERARHEWRVLLVAGMWFQDLFNYDFRRTEMCIIPYATQMGEISFCAYNTGVGWRQVVEKIHQNATTAEWFRTQGRHPIYAAGKSVPLDQQATRVRVPELPMFSAEPQSSCGCSKPLASIGAAVSSEEDRPT